MYSNNQVNTEEYQLGRGLFRDITRKEIESLSSIPLYFDTRRLMIIGLLAAVMTTSVSVALVGEYSSGKSELANVARLMVQNMTDQYQLVLGSLGNEFSQQITKQAIFTKFHEVDYETTLRVKYASPVIPPHDRARTVLCYSSRNFPCIYFHVSRVPGTEINSELALLIRDHMVVVDDALVPLSDCSLVLECENAELVKICPI